jgi:hypothetical protein
VTCGCKITTYNYTARDGTLLEKDRHDPAPETFCALDPAKKVGKKIFKWYHANGASRTGCYQCKHEPRPYRIDELLKTPGEKYIAEGEKCADILWSHGLPATTLGGAGDTWKPWHVDLLKGQAVAVIPDFNDVGLAAAVKTVEALKKSSAAVLLIPAGMREAFDEKEDIEQWLDSGLPIEGLQAEARGLLHLEAMKGRAETPRDSRVWQFDELFDADIETPAGLLAGRVLCPSSVGILGGVGGVGKTWLALGLGAAIARGVPFGPYETLQADVLLISEEMTAAELRHRLRQLFTEDERDELADRVRIICQPGIIADTAEGLSRLRCFIAASGSPGLVLIDALSDIKGATPENDNDKMGALLRGLRSVAVDTESCVAILHHYGKASEFRNGIDRLRGASALRDVVADVISVEKKKGGGVMKFPKVRHGQSPEDSTFEILDRENGMVEVRIEAGEGGGDFEDAGKVIGAVKEEGGRLARTALVALLQRRFNWSERTADRHIAEALTVPSLLAKEKVGAHVFYETPS